jgi:uncharacterized protein (TIRG00374 family)
LSRTAKSIIVIAAVLAVMALAVWLLMHEDFKDLLKVLREARRLLIAGAIATYFLSVVVWALRWRVALASLDCHASIAGLTLIVLSGIFLNNVTPMARLGGDPLGRVYLLQKRAHTRYSSSLAASIGEHAFDPFFTVVLLAGGLFLQSSGYSPWLRLMILVLGGAAAAGVAFGPRLFFKQRVWLEPVGRLVSRVTRWLWRRADRARIVQGVETFYAGIYTTIDTWKRGLLIAGLTSLIWAMDVLRFYLIFLGLGYHPTLGLLLLASSLPVVMGLIPFLPGGLVIVEGSLVALFVSHGVPLEIAMAVTIVERGISYVLSSIVGGAAFSYLGISTAGCPAPQE